MGHEARTRPRPDQRLDWSLTFYTDELGFALDVNPSIGSASSADPARVGRLDRSVDWPRRDLRHGARHSQRSVPRCKRHRLSPIGAAWPGVAVGDPGPGGWRRHLRQISDPDGNTLVLQQMAGEPATRSRPSSTTGRVGATGHAASRPATEYCASRAQPMPAGLKCGRRTSGRTG